MNPNTSFFLDALRVAAALFVLADHAIYFWEGPSAAMTRAAHAAVIVFFVLSGYVIAHSTLGKERGVRAYVIARLSRLYSVIVPALVLTAVLQIIGHTLNPEFAQLQPRAHEPWRYLIVALSLQSVWTSFVTPLANTPFWTLSYEVWYYAIFGAAVLLRRGWKRTLGVLAAVLIAGTDILLLLPCWLAGVAVYAWRGRFPGGAAAARTGFVLSLAAAAAVLAWMPEWPRGLGQAPWWYSSTFLTDWALAFAVAAAVWCFDACRFHEAPRPAETLVRWSAGHTFSLYLFHFPILAFITAVWRIHQPPMWQAALALGGTLSAVLALSTVTEAKRGAWQRGFAWGWDALARRGRRRVILAA